MQSNASGNVLRSALKRISHPFLKQYFNWYLKSSRPFRYKGLELSVPSGVFHPSFFLSSKILMRFLESLDLQGKTLLELGAGSGAVGFYAEKLGAQVTLSDINHKAIEGLKQNVDKLNSRAKIVYSDLFQSIDSRFNYIIINPPYYPKSPDSEEEMAWFCGNDFEYFRKLYPQLAPRVAEGEQVYMILSEDCALDQIEQIALESGLQMLLSKKERRLWEWNYIFSIKLRTA